VLASIIRRPSSIRLVSRGGGRADCHLYGSAVRIEKLAQALGVTKGGFYWHFEDRPALLEEMLDAWERLVIDEVIERVRAGMEYMRSLFGDFCPDEDDVEVRCFLVFSLFIANHFIAADHGARSRADVLKLALTRLLT
jgi:AcrR family transcriptional regulator